MELSQTVEQTMRPAKHVRVVLLVAILILILGVFVLVPRFTSDNAVAYTDAKEHFKYGSTGGERISGIPYVIWKTLPVIFQLPGGDYRSFGFLYEPGRDLPIGVSKRRYRGVDLVTVNCAVCHVTAYRAANEATSHYVMAGPSNTVDLRAYYQFLFAAAKDSRFNAARILSQAEQSGIGEDFLNRQILKFYAVNLTRTSLLDFESRLKFMLDNPAFGPGRIDTFGPAKALLNFATDSRMPANERIGTTDLPSIWYTRKRQGMQLHWDGNNTRVEERNRSAAFGTGAYPATLDRPGMRRIEDFLLDAAPDRYPYPVDGAQASRGKQIYDQLCSACHGVDGHNFAANQGLIGKVTAIEKIGTDRYRLDSYSPALAMSQNLLYAETEDPGERFSHFRKTQGYANMPLDGLWLRAPYLHNGSVPTLRDLLEPSSKRPASFYRGLDIYDPLKVGFANLAEANGCTAFLYDTTKPGNSNAGHEGKEYGTTLPPDDKSALLEYLKTF
jgi:mono/diheme cytochrome c family protein